MNIGLLGLRADGGSPFVARPQETVVVVEESPLPKLDDLAYAAGDANHADTDCPIGLVMITPPRSRAA